jgi:hypothetical protein
MRHHLRRHARGALGFPAIRPRLRGDLTWSATDRPTKRFRRRLRSRPGRSSTPPSLHRRGSVTAIMLAVAIAGLAALIRGRFKRAAALLLAPSILSLSFVFPVAPLEYRALDLLRFYFTKGHYDAVVERLSPAQRVSSILFFEWGTTDLFEAPSYYWLVYDQSGEIVLPDQERSREWKRRISPEPRRWSDEHCRTSGYHLRGHYYSVAMHCTEVD